MLDPLELLTPRLRLRTWTDADRNDLAKMMADPEVMHDYGGPIVKVESDRKLDDYTTGFSRDGYSRWLIESTAGSEPVFIGYAGVAAHTDAKHPLGPHSDIGWRLTRQAWGHGYAAEAANAALADVFTRTGLTEVVSYTSAENTRSRAVMNRLNLVRDSARDFVVDYPVIGEWAGLVWVGTRLHERKRISCEQHITLARIHKLPAERTTRLRPPCGAAVSPASTQGRRVEPILVAFVHPKPMATVGCAV